MKIQEIGVVSTGNTPSKNRREFWNSYDVGFVKPDLLSDDEITYIHSTNEYISNQAKEKSRIANKGSIFISCIGSIGKIGIAQKELAFNQQINVITPYSNINSKYLAYALLANKKRLQEIANAPVVPIINKTQFNNFEIDITLNNDSQLIITGILDKLRDIISKKKEQISMLDNLVKSRFIELFGDPIASKNKRKLSEIGRVFTGNTPSMKEPSYYESYDIPFIKPSDLNESGVTNIDGVEAYVSKKARPVARIIPPNAVLVTCIGTIGKIGITARESCCNQQINFIVPDDGIDSLYLAYCLTFFKSTLQSIANAPVVPIINKTQFSELEVPVFDMDKQTQFAAFVEQTDKSKFEIQKSLEETQKLFDSLMQEYFG